MNLIELKNLSLSFHNKTKYALKNITYQVQPEDFIILLGGNGSGKSSLLKLLYRGYVPTQGSILLAGESISTYTNKKLNGMMGILTQDTSDSFFNSLTLFENYLIMKEAHDLKISNTKCERHDLQVYLKNYNPNLAQKLDCTLEQFSGGEKQALALAFCVMQHPKILLLDEHTSALDPRTSQQIMALTEKIVRENKITCILTTHDLDIALNYGNRALILREGRVDQAIEPIQKYQLTKEDLVKLYY